MHVSVGRYRRNTMGFYDNGQQKHAHVFVVEIQQVFISNKNYSAYMFSMLDPTETGLVIPSL